MDKFSLLCFWLYGPLGFILLRLEVDETAPDARLEVARRDRALKLCSVAAWNLAVSILVIKATPDLEDDQVFVNSLGESFTACRVHSVDYGADLYSRYFGCSTITVAFFLISF